MILTPDSGSADTGGYTHDLEEVNHCHGNAPGHPCEGGEGAAAAASDVMAHPHVQALLKGRDYARDTLAAYAAKNGDDALIRGATWYANKQRGGGSYEGGQLIDQINAARKGVMAQNRAKKKTEAAGRSQKVVELLRQRGYEVGDTVYDRESGERGTLKQERNGTPYILSALGNKHSFGVRWEKKS